MSHSRGRRRHRSRRLQGRKPLSGEQIAKLTCDAYAFLQAATHLNHRFSTDTQSKKLGRQGGNSLLTAMAFNYGVSLELTLKLLHVKTSSQRTYPPHHGYKKLFQELPTRVKADLEAMNSNLGVVLSFQAFVATATPEPPKSTPENVPLSAFEDLLANFDRLQLSTLRYSAEGFSWSNWSEFPYPLDGWATLLNEVIAYSAKIENESLLNVNTP